MPRGNNIQPAPALDEPMPAVEGAGVPAGAAAPLPGQPAHAPHDHGGPPPAPPPAAGDMGELTAPTNRPNEPITAGLSEAARQRAAMQQPMGPQAGPDPQGVLRALYAIYPHPDIERLLR